MTLWKTADGVSLDTLADEATPADLIAAIRAGVESGTIKGWTLIERDKIKYCPMCGRLVNRQRYDDEMCLPSNCDAWKVKAKFDHDTREWVPVSDGGSET